jgi:hypothetical protein
MPQVFIALENTASAFGFKKHNTRNKPDTPKKSSKVQAASAKKYEARQEMAAAVNFDPRVDSSEGKGDANIRLTVDMISTKRGYSYGSAGSLPSLFKRLGFEADKTGKPFDTVVFLGHGNAGLMTAGLGRTPLDKMDALKGKHPQTLAAFNADKRMINVSDENRQHWGATFESNRKHLASNRRTGVLSILFMGCATGNMSVKSMRILPQVVASALVSLLECSVICYGADRLIENAELESALTNLETITEAVAGQGGISGSYALPNSTVSLAWHRANVV